MKTIIIGVDGASISLIKKWKNELPNISNLMDSGSWGELESTIPPITIPAWASFATGKTPKQLGFFDFQKIDFQNRNSRIINFSDWGQTIWDIFGEQGYKVGIINFPGTYPPKKINGFMVSGFLSPNANNIFYPKYLKKIIKEQLINYKIYPDYSPYLSTEKKYINNVIDIFNNKVRLCEYFLKNYYYDVFTCVFMILDWIQHYFWKYMDEEYISYKKNYVYEDLIKNCYKLVDDAIGKLLTYIKNDYNLLILSDHGFGALKGFFNINSWLYFNKYLIPTKDITSNFKNSLYIQAKKIMNYLNMDVSNIEKRIKYKKLFSMFLPKKLIGDDPFTQSIANINVDWKKTKAFGFGYYNTIYINTEERGGCVKSNEYSELVDEITNKLKSYVHNKGVQIKIYITNDEQNDYRLNDPDIIYMIDDGAYVQSNVFDIQNIWGYSKTKSGDHRLNGIWLLKGPRIKENVYRKIKIYDLTPTLCYLYDLSPPKDHNGEVIYDIIK